MNPFHGDLGSFRFFLSHGPWGGGAPKPILTRTFRFRPLTATAALAETPSKTVTSFLPDAKCGTCHFKFQDKEVEELKGDEGILDLLEESCGT